MRERVEWRRSLPAVAAHGVRARRDQRQLSGCPAGQGRDSGRRAPQPDRVQPRLGCRMRSVLGSVQPRGRLPKSVQVYHPPPGVLLTGVILASGFGVCALSGFAPTARFGLLSAIAILIAVVADFTLVPALFGRRQQ